jgi:hypothetical protein
MGKAGPTARRAGPDRLDVEEADEAVYNAANMMYVTGGRHSGEEQTSS